MDDAIKALLDAGLNDSQILKMVTNARNSRADQMDTAARPQTTVSLSATDTQALKAFALRDKDDSDAIAPDRAATLAVDALRGDDVNATMFALIRMFRVAWFQMPHLGPLIPRKGEGATQP